VCREIRTNEILAIKKMRKEDMYQKNQIMHVRTEKEILTTARSHWVVNLRYSFQDDYFLYLVMDFLPGGDLMSLLMKKDILSEDEARFYIAEMILAVEDVHKMNSIHRDLKPDNILIDKNGHIQLSDFGLSKLSENSFFPMSTELKEKEINDSITNATPSGNNNIKSMKKEDIKARKKNRLVK
jgi:serine/threonine kinase 38